MLAALVIVGVFVLSGAGLALVGTGVTLAADLLDAPGDPLPTRAKVILVGVLAGVGAIVTQAIAAKNGVTFDTALATQFATILLGAFVAFGFVTKPVGLSGALRSASVPVLTPVVSKVAAVVASPIGTLAALPRLRLTVQAPAAPTAPSPVPDAGPAPADPSATTP